MQMTGRPGFFPVWRNHTQTQNSEQKVAGLHADRVALDTLLWADQKNRHSQQQPGLKAEVGMHLPGEGDSTPLGTHRQSPRAQGLLQ